MSTFIKLILIMSMLNFVACSQKQKIDLIVANGTIYTVNEDFAVAEAMAVHDGKILDVGTTPDILSKFTADRFIDLEKKAVYPGLIDAHCHFYGYGLGLLQRADLVGTQSFEDILRIMLAHHEKFPSAYWIEGRGWDQNNWPEKAFPLNDQLNRLFPDNPVILTRVDGHAAIVNKKALELAGINEKTIVDGGDVILLNGKPTGVLIDNAIELVTRIIPAPDEVQMAEALMAAQENCFAVGLTGVHDMGLNKREIAVVDSLQHTGKLKMRMYVLLTHEQETLDAFFTHGITKNNLLNIRSIKLYADGALGSRGAKLIKDYSDDPGNSGLLLRSPESLMEFCRKAYDNGFQVCTHAIGDSANRLMLKIYGEILKEKNDLRWRIEHSQIIDPQDFELFGKFSIIPSVQPTHATSDMYWAGDRVGAERMKGAYAYKDLLDQNGWIPLGTDFPIEGINPLHTFYAAVVRKDLKGWPESGFQIENALSRQDALKGMTIWAARSAFEENEKGTLEPGKFADFVIFDQDIMQIPDERLPSAKVLKTFIGGEEVYNLNK